MWCLGQRCYLVCLYGLNPGLNPCTKLQSLWAVCIQKKPWKLCPCPLGASLCCRQGFMCKLKRGLLLHQFWLAVHFSWSDHLLITSCSMREIEFSSPLCIPRGSLKAILYVWHLSVGAFVVICPVTSIPTAGKNPSIHLHNTYLTWRDPHGNLSAACCVLTKYCGTFIKKHFPQKTFSRL